MDSKVGQSKVWRARAEELRSIAEGFTDASAKADLVRLAAQWDRMADKAAATASERSDPPIQ